MGMYQQIWHLTRLHVVKFLKPNKQLADFLNKAKGERQQGGGIGKVPVSTATII